MTAKIEILDPSKMECKAFLELLAQDKNVKQPDGPNICFTELCKFLIVLSVHKGYVSPPPLIDQLWHKFIALNEGRTYKDFCLKHFGKELEHETKSMPNEALQAAVGIAKSYFDKVDEHLWHFTADDDGDCG